MAFVGWAQCYASFSLSELKASWDERVVEVRRKALGFKCCWVFTDECLKDKKDKVVKLEK